MNAFVADPDWGLWIVLYFFFGGLAAGCYFLATLIELFGQEEDRHLARIGYLVAFPLVAFCGVFLIIDLERPERFWHMVLQSEPVHEGLDAGWPLGGWDSMVHAVMLKAWSPMSIGAQALGIFGLCSGLSFMGCLWPGGWLARVLGSHGAGQIFKVIGCLVGFFIAAYTGALMTATNQPLWSDSAWISALFLTSAASTSIALLLLLGGRVSSESRERLERADLWALGLELFVFLVFLSSLGGVLPLALMTLPGLVLVLGTGIVGLLVPLWLHAGFQTPNHKRVAAAAWCALVGGFFLRSGMVYVAPALLHRFPDVTPEQVNAPLWENGVGKCLVGGTLVLGVLIPLVLSRKWELSLKQTGLAGMVSLMVAVAVIFYSLTPVSAQPTFDPLFGLRISPEDERPRGGGPGASSSNRPEKPFFRSNLSKAGIP